MLSREQSYISKAYFSLKNPPAKLSKIAMGDAAISTDTAFEDAPVVGTHTKKR
jgi:hypothetical protein